MAIFIDSTLPSAFDCTTTAVVVVVVVVVVVCPLLSAKMTVAVVSNIVLVWLLHMCSEMPNQADPGTYYASRMLDSTAINRR